MPNERNLRFLAFASANLPEFKYAVFCYIKTEASLNIYFNITYLNFCF